MSALKNGIYSVKTVFIYAPILCVGYLLLMLISAIVSPFRIYLMERLVDSVSVSASATINFTLLLVITIIMERSLYLANGTLITAIDSKLDKRQLPVTLDKFTWIEYSCFEDSDKQDMLQKISENPQSNVLSVFNSLIAITYSVVSTAGILLMFFRSSWLLGTVSFITLLPMFLLESISANKEMALRWNMTPDIRKRYYLQQLFVDKDALQEIKLFEAKQRLIDLSDGLTEKINSDMKKTLNKVILLSSASSIFILAFTGFSLVYLSLALMGGAVTLGVFVSLITSTSSFYNNAKNTVGQTAQFIRLSHGVQYYRDFLSLTERHNPIHNKALDGEFFTIEFKDVSFRYPSSKELVLKDINLTINSDQRIAFVGENGAGKSTMIKLILGLYKPINGTILINGVDNNDISDQDRRRIFSVIFQDYQKYQLTLRENAALGAVDKMQDDKSIRHALALAGADSIASGDLDINLGKIEDDGVELSGGQWQRLALARAYMSDATFIIMDEPTAALDPIAESEMYSQFAKALSHQAAILISHRLASAKMVDKIYVLSNGVICESGTHDVLLERKGVYAEMWEKQSSWYKEECAI